MKNRRIVIWIGLLLLLALIPLVSVEAGRSRTMYLDWRQVVPSGSGNPNMFGEATIEVNAGQAQLCYLLRVFIYPAGNDWPPTGATIHKARFGANGPLVIDLQPVFAPLGDPYARGCVQIDSALAHEIQRDPTHYYLLLTDQSHPEGATRAQLTK